MPIARHSRITDRTSGGPPGFSKTLAWTIAVLFPVEARVLRRFGLRGAALLTYATFLWMHAPPADCDLDRLAMCTFCGCSRARAGATGATIGSRTSNHPCHRCGVHRAGNDQ